MSDSPEQDQLNLWQKLNNLYGDDTPKDHPGHETNREEQDEAEGIETDEQAAEEPDEDNSGDKSAEICDSPGVLGSAVLEEVDIVEPPADDEAGETFTVNEVCADCRYDCRQMPGRFVIANCRLAAQSKPLHENQTPNQVAASQGAMGIEKINETCRRCSRSCKQRTTKLNRMLCLGFLPLDQ
jgi:hypothetical protein